MGVNVNGNGWLKWLLGAAVSIGLFIAGVGVGEVRQGADLNARMVTLEAEAVKGQRWTLEQQMRYMETEAVKHQALARDVGEIKAMLKVLCESTGSGC